MNIFDLIISDKEAVALNDVFLSETNSKAIHQLIKEHKYVTQLLEYDLPVNNMILLEGKSGCGKTTSAKAIATALGRPILILNLANIINARIGETSQNIKHVFDKAGRDKAVLFLDEFDQIGKARGNDDKDVGEMRRLVNTIIQLMDYFPQNALLICATNHAHIVDEALLRRFQVKVSFELPEKVMLDAYYDTLLKRFPNEIHPSKRLYDISYAEAKDYAFTAVKANLIASLEAKESLDLISEK